MRRSSLFVVFILLTCPAFAKALQMPWEVNTPIASVQKSVYVPSPGAGKAAWVDMSYVGPNKELLEMDSVMTSSDSLAERTYRVSPDNGKTWSASEPLNPPSIITNYNGVQAVECEGPRYYDAQAGVLVETWLRQIDGSNHTYYALSSDHGVTWGAPKMLRYEAGNEFDPNNPLAANYPNTNQGYFGNSIVKLSNGKLLTVVGESEPVPNAGLSFIGTWNPTLNDYQWMVGNPVAISSTMSSRGLMEPDAAQLKDGRVLVVWRGSNTSTTPGREWYSVSTDGGTNLSPVAELKYDDGSEFYSPSSFERLIRSSATGKLYWIGNISATAPSGDTPRYPLVIAEVDESGTVPALEKNTVTVIDDRQPRQPDGIQFSNFTVFEDRESHALDLYMTVLGEDPSNTFTANSYKYVIDVAPEPSSLALLGVGTMFLAAWALARRRGKR